jgi:dethiobiotin synthetase
MKTLLVTGTDTGVGKTWISSLLIRHFRNHGIRTGAYKPVCSGAETDSFNNCVWSDVEALRAACGTDPPLDRICPQRFQAAVAPNVAATLEGRSVDDRQLTSAIDAWRPFADQLIVEGAGGIFCPLSDESTVMELAQYLNGPVIVVAANRLGVINHTRLTVDVLLSRGVQVTAIVLNETAVDLMTDSDPSKTTNSLQLQKWIPNVPLLHCDFGAATLTALTPELHCPDIPPFPKVTMTDLK